MLGVNRNTVLRALRELRDEGLLDFRRGRGVTVTGTPLQGAIHARARELVELARRHGYRREELIRLIEKLSQQDLSVTGRLALGLGISALAAAQTAQSALVLRMAVSPARPLAGHVVGLQIRTYAPIVDRTRRCGYRLVAWRVSYPFKVQAVGPNRVIHRVRVRQARGNLYVGRFTPRLQGRWTIRVANFGPSYPACSGSVIRFRVSK